MISLDHLAQAFVIENTTGIFLTRVDLFFQKKGTTPIRFEIRTMENGYPGRRVVPFSDVLLRASDVNISTDGVNNTTSIKFKNPVFLKNVGGVGDSTEYCFALVTDSSDYHLWITNTNNPAVSKPPYVGSLFKASNNFAWLPSQQDSIVFKLYRAKFPTNSSATVRLENNFDKKGLGNPGSNAKDIKYNVLYPNIECIHPTGTSVDMTAETTIESDNKTETTNVLNRNDNFFTSERVINQESPSSKSVQMNLLMESDNEFLSPIIGIGGTTPAPSLRLIGNSINNPLKSDGSLDADKVLTRYVTKPIRLENDSIHLDIRLGVHVPSEADILVYYRTSVESARSIDTIDFAEITPNNPIVKSPIGSNNFNEVVYIKENLTPFDVFEVLILMTSTNTSAIPRIKDLRIIAAI